MTKKHDTVFWKYGDKVIF